MAADDVDARLDNALLEKTALRIEEISHGYADPDFREFKLGMIFAAVVVREMKR